MKVKYVKKSGEFSLIYDTLTEEELLDEVCDWLSEEMLLESLDDIDRRGSIKELTFDDTMIDTCESIESDMDHLVKMGCQPGVVFRNGRWHASVDVRIPELRVTSTHRIPWFDAIIKWTRKGRPINGVPLIELVKKKIKELEEA
jgi:hypothetical protein